MSDGTLFDGTHEEIEESEKKEAGALETLKNLEGKISVAIEKIRTLKEEKEALDRRVRELEAVLDRKNEELEKFMSEKNAIKGQIEGLLSELDGIEL